MFTAYGSIAIPAKLSIENLRFLQIMSLLSGFEGRLAELFGGATLPQIAGKMGVNYHTLRNWVKGRTDIPPSELAKIARLTNGNISWLLTGEGEKSLEAKPLDLNGALRDIIREIVREELSSAKPKRMVMPLELGEQKKTRKAG